LLRQQLHCWRAAVALLAGGSATAAGSGGSSRQLVKTQLFLNARFREFQRNPRCPRQKK